MRDLSWTQLNMFRRCAKQYWFAYKKGIRRIPAGAMVVGRWGHKSLEEDFLHKKETKEDLPLPEFLGTWEKQYDEGVRSEPIDWKGKDPGEWKDAFLGVRTTQRTKARAGLLPLVHKDFLPEREPDLVEHWFTVEIVEPDLGLGIPVTGVVDFMGTDQVVRDFKFRGQDRRDADTSDQLTLYGIALETEGKKVKGYTMDNLVHTKTPKISIHQTKRTRRDQDRVVQEFKEFHRQLTLLGDDPENYPMTDRSSWACSEKWCGFWKLCPRGGGSYVE